MRGQKIWQLTSRHHQFQPRAILEHTVTVYRLVSARCMKSRLWSYLTNMRNSDNATEWTLIFLEHKSKGAHAISVILRRSPRIYLEWSDFNSKVQKYSNLSLNPKLNPKESNQRETQAVRWLKTTRAKHYDVNNPNHDRMLEENEVYASLKHKKWNTSVEVAGRPWDLQCTYILAQDPTQVVRLRAKRQNSSFTRCKHPFEG